MTALYCPVINCIKTNDFEYHISCCYIEKIWQHYFLCILLFIISVLLYCQKEKTKPIAKANGKTKGANIMKTISTFLHDYYETFKH